MKNATVCLKQEGKVERYNNVVKAGRLGLEMQQCG